MLDAYANSQPIAYKILINSLTKNQISHAYLFESNNFQNGFDIALSFAKSLLCDDHYTNSKKCDQCSKCLNVDNNNSINLKIIDADGLWIKKEQLDTVQRDFSKKALNGGLQVYIINHAEKLNIQASNSILKFLEEPQPDIIAILVVNNKFNLLNTIISRCQIISLRDNKEFDNYNNVTEKIAFSLFNSHVQSIEFIEDKHNVDIIKTVLSFITYYERHSVDLLLYTNKYWHSVIRDKDDIINAFSIMILYYKDILNSMDNATPIIFDQDENFNFIKNNNTQYKICDKINTIIKQKEKIQFNVNNALLIDKLIIEMEKLND